MWCFFNGKVLKVCLVVAAALKVGSVVKKSLEAGIKDARMSSFYRRRRMDV